jgi:hypothetical protein
MKKTAVEFLVDNLNYYYSPKWNDILEQAKELEKQQIIDFVNWCNSEDTKDLILDLILVGELNKKPTKKELLEIYKTEKSL